MDKHVRAIAQECGLFPSVLSSKYVESCLPFVRTGLLIGQSDYQSATAERLQRLNNRLHRFGFGSFVLAAAVCVSHLLVWGLKGSSDSGSVSGSLTFLAGFLPALGAAAGVEIETDAHRAIAAIAVRHGGAAKPTGAGGGDIAIAAFATESASVEFRADIAAQGMILLDLNVSLEGVSV